MFGIRHIFFLGFLDRTKGLGSEGGEGGYFLLVGSLDLGWLGLV